ncbi:cell division protein FtsQ [Flavobacterium salilacus subsp. salilacus]|uniref:cell division protein FtsQ/DivIB n=1 Tax=Flavobacterium TaxID=237 RepID=UPI001075595E|nr:MULTISPECIES: cell division protein FtsQ [Flavobacterium]KAF2518096.1 cell division protein FtsQ [Flavobacterium salilacus subsp. salilacus]MBE1615595.1 cell division protein FtsQ [Flavobacterium sp. SaA2.13]
MKKINWNNVRLVVILLVVVFLYSFSGKRNETRWLKEIGITFEETENFITRDKVNKLLIQNYANVTDVRKDKLDLNKLEKSLDDNPMIEKAEVYATIDGKLKAVIRQKMPIARVYRGTQSYYIDRNGDQMPLSESYTARVPLVTGELDKIENEKLQELLLYLYNNDFLKKNIIGIQVNPNGSLKMRSRSYSYEIEFGVPFNIERKLKNYMAFVQDASKDSVIGQYKTINLKFTQQVVCTKK